MKYLTDRLFGKAPQSVALTIQGKLTLDSRYASGGPANGCRKLGSAACLDGDEHQ
jgi:hypothetical protein